MAQKPESTNALTTKVSTVIINKDDVPIPSSLLSASLEDADRFDRPVLRQLLESDGIEDEGHGLGETKE